ncbi:unnamed protein product [Chondrus crispus]|uniref:Uncharacterized protein n=1 Tax=Chondrus crispus TaxID=2769 RepID=R7Q8H0_CHOCR|nr:unnamed protein product [Chondrus crispus]CDF34088.1 unnamed protein product [Chondrus crispus]|eukprot:XP_005713907.1 unnamed protein product [Chondrus crispus]
MLSFCPVPALPGRQHARPTFPDVNAQSSCSVTPVMRAHTATPSVLALAASALLAAGAWHPKVLPPAIRRGAYPAAGVAFLTAALLRPRSTKARDEGLLRPVRAVQIPPVEKNERTRADEGKAGQSVFSASRREWSEPASTDVIDKSASTSDPAVAVNIPNTKSTVYSYSYKRTVKREKQNQGVSANQTRDDDDPGLGVEDMRAAFGHMRGEFITTPESDKAGREQFASTRTRADDWEDAWEEDSEEVDYARRGTSPDIQSGTTHETEERQPMPISSAKLIQQLVRAPMWVLSEVVLPVADTVALVWFDLKVWLLQIPERHSRQGKDRYFLPALKRRRSYAREADDDRPSHELTEEEMQIKQLQTMTKKVVKGMEGTVRNIFKDIL